MPYAAHGRRPQLGRREMSAKTLCSNDVVVFSGGVHCGPHGNWIISDHALLATGRCKFIRRGNSTICVWRMPFNQCKVL